MKTITSILSAAILMTMISCDKEKNQAEDKNEALLVLKSSASEYYDAISNPSAETSDPFELGEITVNGDEVNVTVSYAGGCAPHTFEIIWNEAISLSNPPHISLVIIHEANGDNCEAYITEVLSFKIDSLMGESSAGGVAIDGYNGNDISDSSVYEGNKYEFSFVESDTCNITVTAKEAMCGSGLFGNTWFAMEDSISAGLPDYYFSKFLQPVSIAESLHDFVPESGKKYQIGARIDSSPHLFSDIPICLAYPGPSIPVKILCIKEVE